MLFRKKIWNHFASGKLFSTFLIWTFLTTKLYFFKPKFRLFPNNRTINPHRSILGIGNYDINVIMAALQTKGLEALWFDNRRWIQNFASILKTTVGHFVLLFVFVANFSDEQLCSITCWLSCQLKTFTFSFQFRDLGCLNLNNVYGFILNLDNQVSTNNFISFFSYLNPANIFITRKHWIAVKKINGFYYNLDSKLNFPIKIGQVI